MTDDVVATPPVDPAAAARQRAAACHAEIARVLAAHDCRLVPFVLPPEPVGHDGGAVLVRATYGVIPN